MSNKIEWTDETWNPLTGCTKVSPGCDHCYAKTMHERFNGPGSFDTITLHPDRLGQPLHWRKPRKVFVNSMSDLFHQDVPDDFIARVFAVMAVASRHTFQVLTKRHARMRSLLSSDGFKALVGRESYAYNKSRYWDLADAGWPLRNVWLGASVESQQWADIRVPALLDTPAAVRFLSCEPLLGPVRLRQPWLGQWASLAEPPDRRAGVDWVIVGGESGPGARPMHPDWARSLRDQCEAAGVPFLFKQWGAWRPLAGNECAKVGDEWPIGTQGVMSRRVGKKAAGRELDGRTWDEYPA